MTVDITQSELAVPGSLDYSAPQVDESEQHLRVLVVDDDEVDLELMRRLLKTVDFMRCDVATVTRLSDALQLLRNSSFNVLLLDLNLPASFGLATLDAVRGQDAEIPIVVVSGHDDQVTALRSLHRGAQDYLVKGKITNNNLVNSIRYAVERQRLIRQITTAKELLERKNERLAELYQTAHRFVDNVSHEFRTPLTVIKEYTMLIRDGLVGPVTEQQREFLDTVCDRSDDLNTMVDDMLDVSRLEAGLLGVCRKTCRIEEILENVRAALQRKAAVKGVALTFAFDDNLPEVYCDEEKVRRVIINLTVNAIKFSHEAGHVRVWAKQNPLAPGALLGVTDTGPGIEIAGLKKIFERFGQLETGVRATCKGFGLGLNIAQELVDINLGEMSVDSQPGKGSTFTFTLPPADPREVMQRYLRRLAQNPQRGTTIYLVSAEIDSLSQTADSDDVDGHLHNYLRRDDLAFRADDCHWVLVVASSGIEIEKFYENTQKSFEAINRNRILGALPTVGLRTQGSWNIPLQSAEALAQLEHLLEVGVTADV